MSTLTGTGGLVRLALRRDRIMLPAWVVAFAAVAAISAQATVPLYPTVAQRVQAADTLNRATSLVALYGKIYDPTSLGALAMIKMGGIGAVFVALLAIVTVVRHTRADEEAGRLELVGATVVGRRAPLTAALLVAFCANVALALATAAALTAAGLPAGGSLAFGFAWAGVGIAFAVIAGVIAQVTVGARSATGISAAVLGIVYVLRGIGDTATATGPRWLTWMSPIGWGQQFRPYAGNRWWVLLIAVGFAVMGAWLAFVLAAHRDLGAGLLPDRAGRPAGLPSLRSPLALAWRLQRGSLIGWSVAFLLLGIVFGNIATNVSGLLNSPQAQLIILKLGGVKGITDAFLAAELGIVGIIASAYGIQAAGRLRSEETGLRAEPVLATATGRVRWAGSHITIAIAGSALLMLLAGLGAGLANAARTGHMSDTGAVVGGALVQVPAAWVLAGIVVLAYGLSPRLAIVGWVALAAFLLLGELGPLLGLDQWVMDISPYAHVPRLPGGVLNPAPVVILTAVAALLTAAGLVGFRRRDVA